MRGFGIERENQGSDQGIKRHVPLCHRQRRDAILVVNRDQSP